MNSIEIDLVYGLVGIAFFIFRNPEKGQLYLLSLFIFGLFASEVVYFYVNTLSGQIVWIISALGLLICYTFRIKNKQERGFWDVLKIIGLLLLILYPLPFYSLVKVGDSDFWTVTRLLTFSILGAIYIYDRWILKPEKMKKKYLIVLIGQSLLILLMLMYSFLQKAEADKQRELAEEQYRKAVEMQKEVVGIEVKYQELVKENAR